MGNIPVSRFTVNLLQSETGFRTIEINGCNPENKAPVYSVTRVDGSYDAANGGRWCACL